MKKLKFLNGFLILLIAYHVIGFITGIYLSKDFDYREIVNQYFGQGLFGGLTAYFILLISLLNILGLLYVQRATAINLKNGFFNTKSARKFNRSALFFIISGSINFIFDVVLFWNSMETNSDGAANYSNMGQDFLILLIGFGLYIISDILQNGYSLKTENELTI